MPEGDTVHKVAAYLAPRLEGRRIRRLGAPDPAAARLCTGQRIRRVLAKGKHLFIELDNDWTLRSHLGMYGSWHRYREGENWRKPRRQVSLEIAAGGDVYICFNAKEVELIEAASVRRRILDARVGPDLSGPEVDLSQVVRRAREIPSDDWLVADLLLDQRVAAGIGNVYKSEVLFIVGVLPQRRPATLSEAVLQRCYVTAADLLRRNLGGGPRTTRFENGGAGRLWVYGRAGLPCLRCGKQQVRAARLGKDQRPTFWCPACQM
jgi:endonuclease-8